jgi:hypothetical protein
MRLEADATASIGFASAWSTAGVDYGATDAGLDLRRRPIKPTPARPRINMAQVEGSGTVGKLAVQNPAVGKPA